MFIEMLDKKAGCRQRSEKIPSKQFTHSKILSYSEPTKTELNLGPPKMDFYPMFHLFLPCEN
jgi:hypothetical protein